MKVTLQRQSIIPRMIVILLVLVKISLQQFVILAVCFVLKLSMIIHHSPQLTSQKNILFFINTSTWTKYTVNSSISTSILHTLNILCEKPGVML